MQLCTSSECGAEGSLVGHVTMQQLLVWMGDFEGPSEEAMPPKLTCCLHIVR
jgi:hypothetical protein